MPPRLPSSNLDRDIGALQATLTMVVDSMKEQGIQHDRQMRAQQEQFAAIVLELKSMVSDANKKIEELGAEINAMKSLIDQAKGGWKILVGVGTISAAIGAIIAKIISFLWAIPIR